MACSTCATGSQASDPYLWVGSWLGGVKHTFLFSKKKIQIVGIKAPSTLVFQSDPYLVNTEKFILEGVELIEGVTGLNECVIATGAATLVDGYYDVPTNLTIVSRRGSNVINLLSVASNQNYLGLGCASTANRATKTELNAYVCDGQVNPSNFVGVVYTRRPGGSNLAFDAYVTAGSADVTFNRKSNVKVGDKITIAGTNISDANFAIVTKMANGTRKDGERIAIATLDKIVTINSGVTAGTDGLICLLGIAQPQVIGNLTFSQECGCAIVADFSSTITNKSSFPPGIEYEGGKCGQSLYYYSIQNYTPGAKEATICGGILL